MHERLQAEGALLRDLQALSEDYGLSRPTDDILLDSLDMEPEYNVLTANERKQARWEYQSKLLDHIAYTKTLLQAAGIDTEVDEDV